MFAHFVTPAFWLVITNFVNTGSNFESFDDERKTTRLESLKKAALGASSKFKNSLSRRRRSSSKVISMDFDDAHDGEESKAVDAFRQALILEELLPAKHDDYHKMLRLTSSLY